MTGLLIRLFVKHPDRTDDQRVRESYGVLGGAVGIVCNVLLFIVKLSVGLLTGSIAVAADAVNGVPFSRSVEKAAAFVRICISESIRLGIPEQDGVCFENFLGLLTGENACGEPPASPSCGEDQN